MSTPRDAPAAPSGSEAGGAPQALTRADLRRLESCADKLRVLRKELGRTIVGQSEVISQVLAAILAEGHALLVGVPGLAKTLLVRSVSDLLALDFRRIQFTPDLMPSDITGATLIQDDPSGDREFHFFRGPIFSHVVLADEVNRTPPKTQAALMEAMEERQVTAAGRRIRLDRPFFVLATQNPIEQEGTYPLPISQLDRFLFEIHIDYPSSDEEFRIVSLTTSTYASQARPVLPKEELLDIIDLVRRVVIPPRLSELVTRVVRATRPATGQRSDAVRDWISWGAGPRAVHAMVQGMKSLALLDGRPEANEQDLARIIHPVLRHRIVLSYHAEVEGVRADEVIDRVLEAIPDAAALRREPQRATRLQTSKSFLGRLRGWRA